MALRYRTKRRFFRCAAFLAFLIATFHTGFWGGKSGLVSAGPFEHNIIDPNELQSGTYESLLSSSDIPISRQYLRRGTRTNEPISDDSFYIKAVLEGDMDGNLKVDMRDFAILANTENAGLDGLLTLSQNWLKSCEGHLSFSQNYPTRLARVSDKIICLSDARAGCVYLFNSKMETIGTISGLDQPLGVAADSKERIYVGNNGRDNVEVYNHFGIKLSTIGEGEILMPVDISIDSDDNLYVADSLSNNVKVYDPNGLWLFNIGQTGSGEGEFIFPSALTVAYYDDSNDNVVFELYVADQGNHRIQVFDHEGNFQRKFGGIQLMGGRDWWSWKGRFIRIQSLDFDALGRLHAVDCYMNKVQILSARDGRYLNSYGSYGVSGGQLNLPLDILITPAGQVLVANTENRRIEVFLTVP